MADQVDHSDTAASQDVELNDDVDPLAGLRRTSTPEKAQLGVRINVDTAERLRRFCAVEGINQGEFVDLAIREALSRLGKPARS